MKELITIIFVILTFELSAQKHTIFGYIKDKTTGENLIGGSLSVENLNFGTTSNNFGFYSLSVSITDNSNQIDTLKLVDFNINEYKYDPTLGYYKLRLNESGAILDTLFLKDPSEYSKRGFYKTSRLIGIPEHTYYMKIIHNDMIYNSSAYMPPVPEIDSIGYFKKISEKDGNEYFIPLLYFKEPQGIDNYYLIQLNDDAFSRSGWGASTMGFFCSI